MKMKFYLALILTFISCERNLKKTYFSNGSVESICNYKNGKINGECNYFYKDGQLREFRLFRDGVTVGTSYTYFPNSIPLLVRDKLVWKENEIEYSRYHKNGTLQFNGLLDKENLNTRIGKWTFYKADMDSIVEYIRLKKSSYANQNWLLNKMGDTLQGGNYFGYKFTDSIFIDEAARFRFFLVEPFFGENSELQVVLPSENSEWNTSFSNGEYFTFDLFKSLNKDGFSHQDVPDYINKSHVVEFGLIFEKPGQKNIRGQLIENSSSTLSNKSFKKVMYFDFKLIVLDKE